MPYTIEWHESNKVLIITYDRELTLEEFHQLRRDRAAALDSGPDGVTICADMRTFDAFPDASDVAGDNILEHPQVRGMVIVVTPDVYRQLSRAIVDDVTAGLPVYFVASMDDAFDAADHMQA